MALSISSAQSASVTRIDVSALKIGAPATVAELDLGKLKGDLREIAWSPDGAQLYVQTADGDGGLARLHHYIVPAAGGDMKPMDVPPPWAEAYWNMKSYKSAPGLDALAIDVQTGKERARGSLPQEGVHGSGQVNVGLTAGAPAQNVVSGLVRLVLLDETVGEFVNRQPIPGETFSWGPESSGAIAFTDRDGRLFLFDQAKHKQAVGGVKDATLPAWSLDGNRVAWAQKTARRKYALMMVPVTR